MLCDQKSSSASLVTVQEGTDTVDQGLPEKSSDEYGCASINDPMSISDMALDSSFNTIGSDDLETCASLNAPTQDETPPNPCKMCKKRKNQIRKLKRTQWKLEKKLVSRNDRIEALELEKKRAESRQNLKVR